MGLTPPRLMFTITGGRTGTAWLGAFLEANTGQDVVHEPLEIDDFGAAMPDIRTMRHFNTFGNNDVVQEFWRRKFKQIGNQPFYAETNHTLAKCGLVENLAESELRARATLIVLRRDLVRQCVSHMIRNDFSNVTIMWQWYLHPRYPQALIEPKPFLNLGQVGLAIWYCYEMAARQTYYLMKYGDRLNMVEAQLEKVTKPEGAEAFWEALGGQGTCNLPQPRNQNRAQAPEDLIDKIGTLFDRINFDVEDLVGDAIARGFSFDARSEVPGRCIA